MIRSHGVSLDILREIERLGIEYADATCPFVGKIHQIVFSASEKGVPVLIAATRIIRRCGESEDIVRAKAMFSAIKMSLKI